MSGGDAEDPGQPGPAALAAFYAEISQRLLADLSASGVLAAADDATARREWHAVALHAVIRGVVAEGERSETTADLVDAFHDLVLPTLAPPAEWATLRAHLARRYGEYDGVTRTLGKAGAARVPAAIAAACAKHVLAARGGAAAAAGRGVSAGAGREAPAAAGRGAAASALEALAETLAPLLESLAEGAAAALAEAASPGLELPPLAPLRAITARLDGAGIEWGVGASGLLASLGLVKRVNDWDVQVEVDPERVRELFPDVPYVFHGHGGCHADWKLSFDEARTELIPHFAFFVEDGVVHVPLAVSRHWRGLPIASPEGWACAYALMGELDEPALRARRSERAELLFAHLERDGADAARLDAILAEPLPAPLAARLAALPRRS